MLDERTALLDDDERLGVATRCVVVLVRLGVATRCVVVLVRLGVATRCVAVLVRLGVTLVVDLRTFVLP